MITINRKFFESAAIFCLIATCFALPVATSLLTLFSSLTLVFWLLSGKFKELPFFVKNNTVVLLAMLLLLLFIFGLSYTSASFSDALSQLKKYRELLFFPIVISLLQNRSDVQKRCETSFLGGCIFLLITSYLMYFSIIPAAKYGYSILFHITHNFFMSMLAFYAANKTIDSHLRSARLLWMSVFILCVLNMFYIAPGRTGMFIFFFLMILMFVQRLSLVKQLICGLLLGLLLAAAFYTSDNFHSRATLAIEDIQTYEYGSSRSSLGMRFDWWTSSITLIKKKPVFGYGTGAFEKEHNAYVWGTRIKRTDNPHNEYLLITVQLGIVGLITFLLLFLAQLLCSFKQKRPEALYAQGVLVAMVIGCTTNSFLFDSHQGHFWVILSAVYLSASPICRFNWQRVE